MSIKDVALIYYSGAYGGLPPTQSGVKPGDTAYDTVESIVWEWTGEKWVRRAFVGGNKVMLGPGRNLQTMISSPMASIPGSMRAYTGLDARLPQNFRFNADDLVIEHCLGVPPSVVTCSYYCETDDSWISLSPGSGELVTSVDGNWSIWLGFLPKVIPWRSIITVIDFGAQNAEDDVNPGMPISTSSEVSSSSSSLAPFPAMTLTQGQVDLIEDLSTVAQVSSGVLQVLDGSGVYAPVSIDRTVTITAANLDVMGRYLLPHPPKSIIDSTNTVRYMSTVRDPATGKFVLDFNGIDIIGVWQINY